MMSDAHLFWWLLQCLAIPLLEGVPTGGSLPSLPIVPLCYQCCRGEQRSWEGLAHCQAVVMERRASSTYLSVLQVMLLPPHSI